MWVPTDRNLYHLLTDWGGVIGGIFALIAGWAAYRAGQNQAAATLQAARDQIAQNAKRDRLQAHSMAVAIYPELTLVISQVESVQHIVTEELREDDPHKSVFRDAELVRHYKVDEPQLIRENGHRLFVMGEAGATIFQLLGVILQYNYLVEQLILVEKLSPFQFLTMGKFSELVETMAALVKQAEQEIAPIRDQRYVA
jgi:hypothetical protein